MTGPGTAGDGGGARGAPPVSVLVPVRNEACNLPGCLASVAWSDDVHVVDSGSADGTADIARRLGAHVHAFAYDGGWPKKKNWALASLPWKHDWILVLDADERVSPALRGEMAEAVRRDDTAGYYVRWKFVFLGRWMKHCWRHGWMLRLVRRGRGAYEDLGLRGEGGWDNEVHEHLVADGPAGRLREPLLHESNRSLSEWIAKQNAFSDWNAERRRIQRAEPRPPWRDLLAADPLRRRRMLKWLYLRVPAKPVVMFLYLYVVRAGFLDGRAGLLFCALRAAHELHIDAKVYERDRARPGGDGAA